jgi:hypothetical protein
MTIASLAGVGSYFLLRQSSATPVAARAQAGPVGAQGKTAEPFSLPANVARPTLEEIKAASANERMLLLVKWLPDATAEEIRELVAKGPEDKANEHQAKYRWPRWMLDPEQRSYFALILARWIQVDLDGALAHCRPTDEEVEGLKSLQNLNGNSIFRDDLVQLYEALLKEDLATALARLPEETGRSLANLLTGLRSLVEPARRTMWAEEHAALPEASLWKPTPAELAAQKTSAKPPRPYGLLSERAEEVKQLLSKDLDAARAKLDAMPKGRERAMLDRDYVKALATQKSPEEAVRWAKENLKGLAKMEGLMAVAQQLSSTDPMKAFAILRDGKVTDLVGNRLGVVSVHTKEGSMTSYTGEQKDVFGEVARAAAKQDPKGVLDYLHAAGAVLPRDLRQRYVDRDDQENNGSLARGVYREWAKRDAKSAAAWLAAHPSFAGGSELAGIVAEPLLAANPAEARDFIANFPAGKSREQLAQHAAAAWAATEPELALQWAADLGGASLLSETYRTLAAKNPATAAAHFDALPQAVQDQELKNVVKVVSQAPGNLPTLTQSFTQEQHDAADYKMAVTSYAAENVEQASAWLNSLPDSKGKDRGVSGLVDYLIQHRNPDFVAAAHWAFSSADAEAQGRRLERVADAWKKQDAAGAAEAARQSNLPEAAKIQLLNLLAK